MATIREVVEALGRRTGVDAVVVVGRDGLPIDSRTANGVDAESVAALLPSVINGMAQLGQAGGPAGLRRRARVRRRPRAGLGPPRRRAAGGAGATVHQRGRAALRPAPPPLRDRRPPLSGRRPRCRPPGGTSSSSTTSRTSGCCCAPISSGSAIA